MFLLNIYDIQLITDLGLKTMISKKDIDTFNNQGFLIVRNIFSSSEIDKMAKKSKISIIKPIQNYGSELLEI